MRHEANLSIALLAGLGLLAVTVAAEAAGEAEVQDGYVPPYEMTLVGEDIHEIRLKQSAIDRLDVQTAEVRSDRKSQTVSMGGVVFELESDVGDKTSFFIGIPNRQTDQIVTGGIKVAANVAGIVQEYMATAAALETKEQGYTFFRIVTDNPLLRNGQRVLVETESRPEQEYAVAPYSSLIYDKNGNTWIYVAKADDTFVRHQVLVEFIDGDDVYFLEGPPLGSKVVSVGAAELLGIEYKVGH